MPRFVRTRATSAPLGPIKIAREVWDAQSFRGRDQPNVLVPPFYRQNEIYQGRQGSPFLASRPSVKKRATSPPPFSYNSYSYIYATFHFVFGSQKTSKLPLYNIVSYYHMMFFQNTSEHYSAARLCSILYLVSDMGLQP